MTDKRRVAGSSLRSTALAFAGAAAVAACGSSSSAVPSPDGGGPNVGTLDCSWARGDNCWKSALASAMACLPPSDQEGTLSADLTTCTYATGETVVFVKPVVRAINHGFTLTSGGAPCLTVAEQANGQTITTPAGILSAMEDPGQTTVTYSCPDGTKVSGAPASLASCDKAAPGVGEGATGLQTPDDAGVYSGSLSLSFTGTSNGDVLIFSCKTP